MARGRTKCNSLVPFLFPVVWEHGRDRSLHAQGGRARVQSRVRRASRCVRTAYIRPAMRAILHGEADRRQMDGEQARLIIVARQ